jgi:hypothetical protein
MAAKEDGPMSEINDRLHMDCMPDECLVKDGHCPLHPSVEDERERRQQRVKSLRGQRDQKRDEMSEIQIALNEAILDLHHWEYQQERIELEAGVPRRVIAVEGRATTDGRFIASGALTWPENKPIPIRIQNHHDLVGKAVGKATHLRREDDGSITADIDIRRPVDDDEFFIPFVMITKSHYDDDVLYVTSGRISDLTIMGPLQWPWKTEES